MTAVKGSKQYEMKVVAYHPGRRYALVFAIAASIVFVAALSYWYGGTSARQAYLQAVEERDTLRVEVVSRGEQIDELRQQVANLELGSQVDRKASEGVRTEVIELKSRIAQLQEDISFYRSLMAPSDNQRGLTIGSLDVLSTGVPRQYEYKLIVQQLATRHTLLNGSLKFNVVGRQREKMVTLPLKDLSDSVAQENIKLRFKYFQTLEGRLQLPEEFEPVRIELVARSTGKQAVVVEKKFGWLVQEG
jgi:hypothetical protein